MNQCYQCDMSNISHPLFYFKYHLLQLLEYNLFLLILNHKTNYFYQFHYYFSLCWFYLMHLLMMSIVLFWFIIHEVASIVIAFTCDASIIIQSNNYSIQKFICSISFVVDELMNRDLIPLWISLVLLLSCKATGKNCCPIALNPTEFSGWQSVYIGAS